MKIVLTGSVAFDYLMSFPGYFKDHILPEKIDTISLSFLVESMIRLRGGIAPNIAYTLALLGGHPYLFATVGEDFEEYRLWLESHGVDTTWARVIPGEYTASFFANTDRSNAQIASFYPGAMGRAVELSLREMASDRPDLVLISPNDPAAMLQYVEECREIGLPYIYDPSQQIVRLQAEDLLKGIVAARAVFVNEYEFALIQKVTNLKIQDILGQVDFLVITLGERGARIYSQAEEVEVPIVPPSRIIDPTGVGDAFRGGFITGYRLGLSWQTCGWMGSMAATYCLEQRGPQAHFYTPAEFVVRLRTVFDDQGELDHVLNQITAK